MISKCENENGQAMVEFALVLPVLLLLLCGILNFGWIYGNQLAADSASRQAARYTAIHYYDSGTDNDAAIAAGVVAASAPTLVSPSVTLTVSGACVTVGVTSSVSILTPIIASLFPGGVYTVEAQCIMRLE